MYHMQLIYLEVSWTSLEHSLYLYRTFISATAVDAPEACEYMYTVSPFRGHFPGSALMYQINGWP